MLLARYAPMCARCISAWGKKKPTRARRGQEHRYHRRRGLRSRLMTECLQPAYFTTMESSTLQLGLPAYSRARMR